MVKLRSWKVPVIVLGVMIFVWITGAVAVDMYGLKEHKMEQYDAILVLGCRVQPDGMASLALQRRTRTAFRLLETGKADKIVLTGGVGSFAPSEAEAAKTYAVNELGAAPELFLLEERSTSTEENAKFAAMLYPELSSVLVVSDSYHIFRAERVFRRYFEHVDGHGSPPKWNVRLAGMFREVLALGYYYAQGRL